MREVEDLLEVRHVSVSINRSPEAVYGFAATIENLPQVGGRARQHDSERRGRVDRREPGRVPGQGAVRGN